MNLDRITLEVWWSRLVAIADEAATTLLRTAFSTIIRESNDYTVVLMNTSGQTIAECHAGIPGFAALMSALTRHLLATFPAESWRDGDIVITNDPWIATGHLPDIAMVTPIFHQGALVGFTGTVAHLPDIGGTPALGVTVLARHLTGHLLCCAVYRALGDVLPDRVIADSGGSPALRVQFAGRTGQDEPFALLLFASAGMGASARHDGLPTTASWAGPFRRAEVASRPAAWC